MDILQACDLKKTYGTGEACVHALDGVSLNGDLRHDQSGLPEPLSSF